MVKKPNRLIGESSPYLLQHAYNPVDWYPWCAEATRNAKEQDKPILLSIGYSACHWCHVMEKESFEDYETAEVMNKNFICIKVDREERPDLDSVYMKAVQAMTGSGGWPMTVFLTPQGKPFYGGTYFPPEPRHGMPSFRNLLNSLSEAYKNHRERIEDSATELLDRLQPNVSKQSSGDISHIVLKSAFINLNDRFDDIYGGFSRAPKFPQPMLLEFLLRFHLRDNNSVSLKMVEKTLTKMANGGIYDHIGGGFHRYSVDSTWLVPHFEKMLYDNAQLARLYLHAYQLTRNDLYRSVVEDILNYIIREMTHPLGGFYSTQDADSEGHEGKFYVWSFDEIKSVLGGKHGEVIAKYFGITKQGNFEGKNILTVTGDDIKNIQRIVGWRSKLLDYRNKRIKPQIDNKIITSWNGLMMASFAEAGNVLNRPDYTAVAEKNADFILTNLLRDGRLLRTWKDGQAKLQGYLEDYSFYIDALLSLYQTTFKIRWFQKAKELAKTIVTHFVDKEGTFCDTGDYHERLVMRPRDLEDNAMPSGASMAARVLLILSAYTGEEKDRSTSEKAIKNIMPVIEKYPVAFTNWLSTIDFYISTPNQVVIIGDSNEEKVKILRGIISETYRPNTIVTVGSQEHAKTIPLLAGKTLINDQATAYVCYNSTCNPPTIDHKILRKTLDRNPSNQ